MDKDLLAGLGELAERPAPIDERLAGFETYDPKFEALREWVRWGHLNCTFCSSEHVDSGELANVPHKTHLCKACGKRFPSTEGYVRSVGIRHDVDPYDTYNLLTDAGALDAVVFAHGWQVTKWGQAVWLHQVDVTVWPDKLLAHSSTYDTSIENQAAALIEAMD